MNIFHDLLTQQSLQYYWSLLDQNGEQIAGENKTLAADYCSTFHEKIVFTVTQPGDYVLTVGIVGQKQQSFPVQIAEKKPSLTSPNLITQDMEISDRGIELLAKAAAGETIVILVRDDYPEWLPEKLFLTQRNPAINFTFR